MTDERQRTSLRRIETVIAQARGALAAGAVPDLTPIVAELQAVGPIAAGSEAAKQLLAISAEVEMLTQAARLAQAALRDKLDGTGRSQMAARAYMRAMPGGRA